MSENYKRSVYEIQEYLKELHHAGFPIGLVHPDGIYGDETRTAVREFQKYEGLPQTGVVDRDTWDRMYLEYSRSVSRRSRTAPLYPFPSGVGYATERGEISAIIKIIQLVLTDLSTLYDDVGAHDSGVYDADTAESVRNFQKRNGLGETGVVDGETWERLADIFNRHNNSEH